MTCSFACAAAGSTRQGHLREGYAAVAPPADQQHLPPSAAAAAPTPLAAMSLLLSDAAAAQYAAAGLECADRLMGQLLQLLPRLQVLEARSFGE